MNYVRFGRALVPEGGLFEDVDAAIEMVEALEQETMSEELQHLRFTTTEEGLLTLLVNNKRFLITLTALKDLCKILKVPVSYINKFPGRDLILENLNNNPYLKNNEDRIKMLVWKGEEEPVISGILPVNDPAMLMKDYLALMQQAQTFERENILLDHIAITDEAIIVYFYQKEEIQRDGYSFHGGYAISYSATKTGDTIITPFCKMAIILPNGEPFDFDFEGIQKIKVIKRKDDDFAGDTLEYSQQYQGEDLGPYYEELMKYATVCQNMSTIKFSVMKYFKSRAVSVYNYNGIKLESNTVSNEIMPEYRDFNRAHKNELKNMATYAANHLPVDFSIPVFFNRIFTYPASIESPYYFIRYRRAIGNMLNKLLDETGDLVVDSLDQEG